ncbi:hypothetical protein F5Y13DRAFT_151045 [Hypoxylon sp. FL1857]|nr:hypothetical protein F5Y13DRAFT_151045 [Hypoxylon sp. FL1857]
MTTLNYTSRIPVKGITDIICPHSRRGNKYSNDLCKDIATSVLLSQWEVDFVKSHLDPKCESGRIHYVFPEFIKKDMPESSGLCFLDTDCVELWLGLARLTGLNEIVQEETPIRIFLSRIKSHKALHQLQHGLSLLKPHYMSRCLVMKYDERSQVIFMLMDRARLDCRAAVFLGDLADRLSQSPYPAEQRDIALLLGVMIVVFDNHPILRRRNIEKPAPLTNLDLEGSCLGEGLTSDAWNNIAYWLRHVGTSENGSVESLPSLARKNWAVERSVFVTALARVKRLADHFQINRSWLTKVLHSSFLSQVQFMVRNDSILHDYEYNPISRYLDAYRYNLIYFTTIEAVDTPLYGTHVSSKQRVLVDLRYLTVDVQAEAERVKAEGCKGFYACASF